MSGASQAEPAVDSRQTGVRTGTCSCGQLRVTVTGAPKRVSICHCAACQKRTGAPFGEQARFPRASVSTEGSRTSYVRTSDEGRSRTHSFCPCCGSTVWYVLEGDDEVSIPVGAFADADFAAPTRSVWERRRHKWVSVPGGAERQR